MNRFKNILAVLAADAPTEPVLSQVRDLARVNRASITIIEPIPLHLTSLDYVSERQAGLDKIAKQLRGESIDVCDAIALSGGTAENIVEYVTDEKIDILFTAQQDRNMIVDAIFGDMARELARLCPCPVWIVKRTAQNGCGKVLAAIDIAAADEEAVHLNKKTMDLATSIAAANNSELIVLSAWLVEGKDRDSLASELPRQVRESLMEKHVRKNQIELQKLLNAYRNLDLKYRALLPQGSQAEHIALVAEREDIDVVVLGAKKQSWMSRAVLGDRFCAVLGRVSSGVLAVKMSDSDRLVREESVLNVA